MHENRMTPGISGWAASEERADAYLADLMRLRHESQREAGELDQTSMNLGIRYPFSDIRGLADGGELTIRTFRAVSKNISRLLFDVTQDMFDTYLDAPAVQQRKFHGNMRGFLSEVSFHLLMLHAANTRDVITLPAPLIRDHHGGRANGYNLSIDAQVFADGSWQDVQIKTKNNKGRYHPRIKVVMPPLLPLRDDPNLDLPLNVFYDFVDYYEDAADQETLSRMNTSAAQLARSFEANS